ncbi:hypothetical protein B0H19DRAFT_1074004 [Mycena capillaripes]|nr:hypothetical protein B0H19DRAFT_1074004 [Mycena capillaripes]
MPATHSIHSRGIGKLPTGGGIALIVCITILGLLIIAVGTYFDRRRAQRTRQANHEARARGEPTQPVLPRSLAWVAFNASIQTTEGFIFALRRRVLFYYGAIVRVQVHTHGVKPVVKSQDNLGDDQIPFKLRPHTPIE